MLAFGRPHSMASNDVLAQWELWLGNVILIFTFEFERVSDVHSDALLRLSIVPSTEFTVCRASAHPVALKIN